MTPAETTALIEVMKAYVSGEPIEYCERGAPPVYTLCNSPSWDWGTYQYRIALVDDYIDWSHVHPDYKFMARNSNGDVWLFAIKPTARPGVFVAPGTPKAPVLASYFASLKVGNKAWLQSLVERPA